MSWKWFVASISTLLTLIISILNIFHQYMNLVNPKIQLCICRILTMIPVYAVLSYVSYLVAEYSVPLNIIRDCYEAYVMHSFLQLLTIYVGGDVEVVRILISSKDASGEIWPQYYFNCDYRTVFNLKNVLHHFRNNSVDINSNCDGREILCRETNSENDELKYKMSRFYSYIKLGVFQFVIIKPLTAVLSLFLENLGYYKPGKVSYKDGFLYIITINMISVSISVYSLFLLYVSLVKKLLPIKPVLKFFCIKLIIFVSFWQSIILSMFNHLNIYSSDDPTHIVKLQNWLLTVEMTFCAIIFGIAFRVDKGLNNNAYPIDGNQFCGDDTQSGSTDRNGGKRQVKHPDNNSRFKSSEKPFANYIVNEYSKQIRPPFSKNAENAQRKLRLERCTKKLFVGIARIFDPLDIVKDSVFLLKSLNNPHYSYTGEGDMHNFSGAIVC
ncbi:hypothetical protein FG386_002405 [Cryptosporidium ryanae]|uniref:uncharacterized protein n=1 Tax=Cryptosporidium ryanae TaxID=515981 RepID=UPI00351A9272|nr:hypothetical protein FG386_002405 [Cryptosporidium ryanae]